MLYSWQEHFYTRRLLVDVDTEIDSYYIALAVVDVLYHLTRLNVMGHEFGHWVMFNDISGNPNSVMYGSYNCQRWDSKVI
ncbi:hypothetical protein HRbin05_00694 [archaeon HR05]|nr:hypothetical protein HRbin05_00694 [archaeon HR05]